MGIAPDAIKRLVDHFDQNRKVFVSSDYKEEQLRAEFLTPLFESLGWDMDIVKNTIGKLAEGDPPARLTNVCHRLKMQPTSAHGRQY